MVEADVEEGAGVDVVVLAGVVVGDDVAVVVVALVILKLSSLTRIWTKSAARYGLQITDCEADEGICIEEEKKGKKE